MASLQEIDHIVVLMLENRSFDSLLGTLYPRSDSFEGLNGTEQNPDANGTPVVVWNSPGTDETTMRIPNPDPGELWTDINMQLFGSSAPAPGQRPTMVGFVQNYLAQRQLNPQQTYDPKSVMHYFAPAQLPVLSQLAQKLAVWTIGSLQRHARPGPTAGSSMLPPPTAMRTMIRRIFLMCRQPSTAWNRPASIVGRSIFT